MLKAVIDLGTNTFNLLIAEVKDSELNIIFSEKEPVMLGLDGIHQGMITDEAMKRALETLGRFRKRCDTYGINEIKGFGTSAIRGARNKDHLIETAFREFNIDIQPISGKQEAEMIYHGVQWSYKYDKDVVIMDIGGGSTEFVHASSKGFIGMESLDIGVLRIYHLLGEPENYTHDDYERIYRFLDKHATEFFNDSKTKILIGASGSFETLYEMIHCKRFNKPKTAQRLELDDVNAMIDWVLASTQEDREHHEWIIPIRKKLLPIAAVKIRWVIQKFGIKEIWISPYSLKEGAFSVD